LSIVCERIALFAGVVVMLGSAKFVIAKVGYYAELAVRLYRKSRALGNRLGIVSGSG
jgi:hypothetical protein